jgi:hypothetical protein
LVTVFNLGSVKSMSLPKCWKALPLEHGNKPGQVSQPYAIKGDEAVRFVLFYRGHEIYDDVAADLCKLLKLPPHDLDAREFSAIEIVLRNMSEDDFFDLEFARTTVINGKTLLVAQGVWKSSGLKNLGIFIGSDKANKLIDELHYYAPEAKFEQYLPAAQEILHSLRFVDVQ